MIRVVGNVPLSINAGTKMIQAIKLHIKEIYEINNRICNAATQN